MKAAFSMAYRYLVTTYKGNPISKSDTEAAIRRVGAQCGVKNLQKRYRETDWDAVRSATAAKAARVDGKLKAPAKMRLTQNQTARIDALPL